MPSAVRAIGRVMETTPLKTTISAVRKAVGFVAFVSLGINLLTLSSAIYMMQVYDNVLTSRNIDTLILLSVIVAFALIVLGVLDGLRAQMMVRVAGWFEQQLSAPVMASAIAAGVRGGGSTAQGLRDLASLRAYIASPNVFPLFDAPFAPVFLAIIFLAHPLLGTIAFAGMVLLFVIGVINDRITRRAAAEANSGNSKALNFAEAVIRNADVVSAMGIAPGLQHKLAQVNGQAFQMQRLAADRSGILSGMAKGLRFILQSAVLGFGAWLVIGQEITPGLMIASAILMGRALAPVEQSIGAWRALTGARTTYARLAAMLRDLPIGYIQTKLPDPQGQLSVETVIFVPPESNVPLIRGVSFRLNAGEAMALIGPSGSGKSTLARLLVGSLTPARGAVRLDGADMAHWAPAEKGRHVGYLPQEIELLDGTVWENIARFDAYAEDREVVAAAQLAGVHELILNLPDGYETQLGVGGIKLSGGLRQRIGLARAVFRLPRFIVLDEPNSNLDAVGEQALVTMIGALKQQGCTMVIVAHRPRILAEMDKALILQDGAVAKFGPRDEVLQAVTPAATALPAAEQS